MPLTSRTMAIPQLSLVDCNSTTFLGAGSRSADTRPYKMGMKAGQEGDEINTLICQDFSFLLTCVAAVVSGSVPVSTSIAPQCPLLSFLSCRMSTMILILHFPVLFSRDG